MPEEGREARLWLLYTLEGDGGAGAVELARDAVARVRLEDLPEVNFFVFFFVFFSVVGTIGALLVAVVADVLGLVAGKSGLVPRGGWQAPLA